MGHLPISPFGLLVFSETARVLISACMSRRVTAATATAFPRQFPDTKAYWIWLSLDMQRRVSTLDRVCAICQASRDGQVGINGRGATDRGCHSSRIVRELVGACS